MSASVPAKYIEREFDEIRGLPVYGWTKKQKQPQPPVTALDSPGSTQHK